MFAQVIPSLQSVMHKGLEPIDTQSTPDQSYVGSQTQECFLLYVSQKLNFLLVFLLFLVCPFLRRTMYILFPKFVAVHICMYC